VLTASLARVRGGGGGGAVQLKAAAAAFMAKHGNHKAAAQLYQEVCECSLIVP
jgi:hypothetical protein